MSEADDLLRRTLKALQTYAPVSEAELRNDIFAYLAAPKDEPFAWMIDYKGYLMGVSPKIFPEAFPVYLHPPTKTAPKPMTWQEMQSVINEWGSTDGNMGDLIRAIERHHGIGGGE